MVAADEDALICDFAETYNVYDWRRLPLRTAASLAVGLRGESRIWMSMRGFNISLNQMLLAIIADDLNFLCWAKTEDGTKGINRPSSILSSLLGKEEHTNVVGFTTAEEFEKKRKQIIEG